MTMTVQMTYSENISDVYKCTYHIGYIKKHANIHASWNSFVKNNTCLHDVDLIPQEILKNEHIKDTPLLYPYWISFSLSQCAYIRFNISY